ncbi:MAG: hypothetical protein ACJAZ3_000168 [Sphingobacteriales bacterium]
MPYFNPETGVMDYLLYTVTYYSGEKTEKFNCLEYSWQTKDDLIVPKSITGFKYKNDSTYSEPRYYAEFTNVQFQLNAFADSVFARPKVYGIDSLIKEKLQDFI